MTEYDFTFITEDGSKDLLKKVEELVKESGGSVSNKEEWGEKQFAYRIGSLTKGHYHLWTIEINSQDVKDLKNNLNIEDDIVRYLIVNK